MFLIPKMENEKEKKIKPLQEFNSVSTRCILTDNSKSIHLQATLNQTLRFILYTICHIQINLTSCLKTVIGSPISPMHSEEYHANATQQGLS